MDQGYAQFKPACFESTLRVAAKKMAARTAARKKMKDQVKQSTTDKNLIQQNDNEKNTSVDELKEFLDNEGKEGNADDKPCKNFCFEVKGSHCNVKLDNNDLSAIVNGYPGDPIELRPFNKIFTRQNILKWWCKVGFIPMSRNALNDNKVRQQLGGETAAVGDNNQKLELLVSEYEKIANK